MKTKMRGGLKRFITGESLFINEFTAQNGPGEIGIAPGAPGDLDHVYLENDTIYLQNTAYVASSPAVNIETKWQGFIKGFFSGESLFLIKCSGQGDVWFNTFGGMICIDVDGSYVVDTGHIVAFTEGLQYTSGASVATNRCSFRVKAWCVTSRDAASCGFKRGRLARSRTGFIPIARRRRGIESRTESARSTCRIGSSVTGPHRNRPCKRSHISRSGRFYLHSHSGGTAGGAFRNRSSKPPIRRAAKSRNQR
jgi:hypothetical protein